MELNTGYLLYGVSFTSENKAFFQEKEIEIINYKRATLYYKSQINSAQATDIQAQKEEGIAFFKILESLHTQQTLIPFRYKTVLLQKKQLTSFLKDRYDAIFRKLTEVEGYSEFSLKVLAQTEETEGNMSAHSTGKEYMQHKFQAFKKNNYLHDKVKSVQAFLQDELNALSIEFKIEETKKHQLFYLNILIKNEIQSEYKKLLKQIEKKHPEFKYFSSGPWPIFTFGNFMDF